MQTLSDTLATIEQLNIILNGKQWNFAINEQASVMKHSYNNPEKGMTHLIHWESDGLDFYNVDEPSKIYKCNLEFAIADTKLDSYVNTDEVNIQVNMYWDKVLNTFEE